MGTYACLIALDYPDDTSPVALTCHANSDNWTIGDHSTNVFLKFECDYTTVPRWFYVSGYAWARSVDGKQYTSVTANSQKVVRYCHVKRDFWSEVSFTGPWTPAYDPANP